EECLLSPVQARNPGVSREELEEVLGAHLGVRKVLWLGNGIAGDDTHGHVDDLARFVDPRTVVIAEETDRADDNYQNLADNRVRGSSRRPRRPMCSRDFVPVAQSRERKTFGTFGKGGKRAELRRTERTELAGGGSPSRAPRTLRPLPSHRAHRPWRHGRGVSR